MLGKVSGNRFNLFRTSTSSGICRQIYIFVLSTYNRIIGNMKDRFLRKSSALLCVVVIVSIWGLTAVLFAFIMMVSWRTLSFSNTLSRLTNKWICSKAPHHQKFLPKFFEISTRSPRARDNIDHLASVLQIEQAH